MPLRPRVHKKIVNKTLMNVRIVHACMEVRAQTSQAATTVNASLATRANTAKRMWTNARTVHVKMVEVA